MATRSPSRRLRSLTRSPLTSDPLEELQSRRKYWLPRYSITAWRRDTIASGRTTSLEGSRPIEQIVRASAISRREEEVGLMMILAIGARRNLTSEEGLAPRDPHLHFRPLLHAGREFPRRTG